MAQGDDGVFDELQVDVELATDLISRKTGLGPVVVDGVTVEDHSARHENGGADEISVAGLSGTLADPQTPTAHASTHEDGGSDEITIENLPTGETDTALVLKPDGAGGVAFGAGAAGPDQEAGKVASGSFASSGGRQKATVTFAQTYVDPIPTLAWDRSTKRSFTIESLTTTGMVIVASSNAAIPAGNVYYQIVEAGSY